MRFEHNEGDENLGPLDAYSPLDTIDDYVKALEVLNLDLGKLKVSDSQAANAFQEDVRHVANALEKNRKLPALDRLPSGDRQDVKLELKRLRKLFREKMNEIE